MMNAEVVAALIDPDANKHDLAWVARAATPDEMDAALVAIGHRLEIDGAYLAAIDKRLDELAVELEHGDD